jgi:hypothetical protein
VLVPCRDLLFPSVHEACPVTSPFYHGIDISPSSMAFCKVYLLRPPYKDISPSYNGILHGLLDRPSSHLLFSSKTPAHLLRRRHLLGKSSPTGIAMARGSLPTSFPASQPTGTELTQFRSIGKAWPTHL